MYKPLKVFQIVSTFYPHIGGAQRATGSLSQGLIAEGLEVEVITSWQPGLKRYDVVNGVTVRRLGLSGPGKLRSLTFGVHALCWILLNSNTLSIFHTQNMDTPFLIGVFLKLITGKRWVNTIHGEWHIPRLRQTYWGRFRLFLMRHMVDHFIAISQENKKIMIREGIPLRQITLIANGIDTSFFRPATPQERKCLRAQYGYKHNDIVVLYLGRLVFHKRVDLMLDAFAKLHPDDLLYCLVVGDGPEMNKLKEMANWLGIFEQVKFVGSVTNVRDYFWLSDIFVLPSRHEGLPVALLEAMSSGLAVLGTRNAGNLELIKNYENGLTSKIDDVSELFHKLKLFRESTELRKVLGNQARSKIVEKYSLETVTNKHISTYSLLFEHYNVGLSD